MVSVLKRWRLALQSLQEGLPVMLLYVLESKGSSPGRQGFFMVVNSKGEMEGSIGGGIMEHKLVEMAREKLNTGPEQINSIRRQVHDPSISSNKSGMICSGEQSILLYQFQKKDLQDLKNLVASIEDRKNGELVLEPGSFQFNEKPPVHHLEIQFIDENRWRFTERTGYKNHLYIIGGGHCSLALSRLMSTMDFYISVFEERSDLKTIMENTYAQEIHQVPDYTSLSYLIPSDEQHYVVVMTFGFRTDDIALRALRDKKFKYLGVLGSQKKMDFLFDSYRNEGFSEEFIKNIHSPIGLQIKSQTPEEIAISIAAEIIREKNK